MTPLILASFCLSLLFTGVPATEPTIAQDPAVRGTVRLTSPEGTRVFRLHNQDVQEEKESKAEKSVCPHCGQAIEGSKNRKGTVWYSDGEKSEGRVFALGEGGEFRLLEGGKGLEGLKNIKGLESLKGLQGLKDIQKIEGLKVLKDLKGWTGSDGKKIEVTRPMLLQRTRSNEQGTQEHVIEVEKSVQKKDKKSKAKDKKSKGKKSSNSPHTIIIIRSGNGAQDEVEVHGAGALRWNGLPHGMSFSMPTIDISSLATPHFVMPDFDGKQFEFPTINVPTFDIPELQDLQIELQDLNVELKGLEDCVLPLPGFKFHAQPAAPAVPQKHIKQIAPTSTRHLIHL